MREFVVLMQVEPIWISTFFCGLKWGGVRKTPLVLRGTEIDSIEIVEKWWNDITVTRVTLHNRSQFYVSDDPEEILKP